MLHRHSPIKEVNLVGELFRRQPYYFWLLQLNAVYCYSIKSQSFSFGYYTTLLMNIWALWFYCQLFFFACHIYEGVLKSSYADDFFLPTGSKHCNANGRTEWTVKATMLKNKSHFVTFSKGILVSLWAFQMTII